MTFKALSLAFTHEWSKGINFNRNFHVLVKSRQKQHNNENANSIQIIHTYSFSSRTRSSNASTAMVLMRFSFSSRKRRLVNPLNVLESIAVIWFSSRNTVWSLERPANAFVGMSLMWLNRKSLAYVKIERREKNWKDWNFNDNVVTARCALNINNTKSSHRRFHKWREQRERSLWT